MGTSFSSIHLYSDRPPFLPGFRFSSFSKGWQTCIDDFSNQKPEYPFKAAIYISKRVSAPVLYFSVYDGEHIELYLFQNGKTISRFDEISFSKSINKSINLYGIPALIGYKHGEKRRLAHILYCDSTDLKIELLEEYFGVCLLPFPEYFLERREEELVRWRSREKYNSFLEEERQLGGNNAPICLYLLKSIHGKLFHERFLAKKDEKKEHCFLLGYFSDDTDILMPVRFTGNDLISISEEEFVKDRIPKHIDFVNQCTKTTYTNDKMHLFFLQNAPHDFTRKSMALPRDTHPVAFDNKGRLILEGKNRLYFVDDTLKIIARCPIKGSFADIIEDHILVTSESSFYAYCYDPGASISIYKITEQTP